MRSIWNGHIRFSLVTIPISLYSSSNSSNEISFDQLHDEDHGRIRYKRVCQTCEEEVEYKDIVKGYEYAPEQYVVITPDELDKVKLDSEKAIDISAFVDIEEVHPSRFEAVYFVGPNDEVARKTFNLFRTVLKNKGKAAIGRLVLRDKEDVVLLTPEDEAIILYKLRYPYELKDIKDVPNTESTEINDDQLKLAEQLVDSLAKPFADVNFEDRYRDKLLKLIEQKVEGEEIVVVSDDAEEAKPTVDIMDALKKSIEEAKKKKAG